MRRLPFQWHCKRRSSGRGDDQSAAPAETSICRRQRYASTPGPDSSALSVGSFVRDNIVCPLRCVDLWVRITPETRSGLVFVLVLAHPAFQFRRFRLAECP